jgi:hypothetical protein
MKKPKKIEPPKKDYRLPLYIEIDQRCTRDEREDIEWGSWETHYDSTVTKISTNKDLLNKWDFQRFNVPQSTYDADHVYAVIVTYESGDTFGRSYGNVKVAFVSEKAEDAIAAEEALNQEWTDKWRDHPNSCGYAPWDGYFERITNISIELFKLLK